MLTSATTALLSQAGDGLLWAAKVIVAGFGVLFLFNLATARAARARELAARERRRDELAAAADGMYPDPRIDDDW